VITIFEKTVLVQERAIWQSTSNDIGFALKDNNELIEALKTELNYQVSKRLELTESEQEKGRAVTIIGDASIPYVVLKQIMAACADTGYRNMSLAVERQARKEQGEG
jgi:biopolymer transport protein ExbD